MLRGIFSSTPSGESYQAAWNPLNESFEKKRDLPLSEKHPQMHPAFESRLGLYIPYGCIIDLYKSQGYSRVSWYILNPERWADHLISYLDFYLGTNGMTSF